MSKMPGYTRDTAASQRRKKIAAVDFPSTPVPTQPSSRTANSLATSTAPSTTQRNKAARATDSNFRAVLDRYGISIVTKHDLRSPFDHFGTDDPMEDPRKEGYAQRVFSWYWKNHEDCDVWLALNQTEAEEVARQYELLNSLKENEAKYAYRGKVYFFREDKLVPPNSHTRINTTFYKLEWGPSPDGKLLHCPPQVTGPPTPQPAFGFVLKPDITYWLTLCRMNPLYRNLVPSWTYALPTAKAVAPYLTVEFKKDNQDFEAAENQLAASAALTLYNRVRLRCERLNVCEVPQATWRKDDFEDLKHYGIGFNGSEVRLYLARPSLALDESAEDVCSADGIAEQPISIWRGCQLANILVADVTLDEAVLRTQQWINEIHNWGLGEYSEQFVFDIKGILVKQEGGLHRVSMTTQDMKDWGLVADDSESHRVDTEEDRLTSH